MIRKWGEILKEKSDRASINKPTWFAQRAEKLIEAAESGRYSIEFTSELHQAECDSLYIYCRHEGLKFYSKPHPSLGGLWKVITISWSKR